MSLCETEEPLVPMASAPTPPRSWQAMLVTWAELMATLAAIVGEGGPVLDADGLAALIDRLHLLTWTWMWSLPPCSEARKAALTLGAAALWIERWRAAPIDPGRTTWGSEEDPGYVGAVTTTITAIAIGQHAESLLRIAAWHIDDARALARTLGVEPAIPPHERVYRPVDLDGHVPAGNVHPIPSSADPLWKARRILDDHFKHRPGRGELIRAQTQNKAFAELAIASLPDGPWVMTNRDVEAFLDIQEVAT